MTSAGFQKFFSRINSRVESDRFRSGFSLIPDEWPFQIFTLEDGEFRPFMQRGYKQNDYRYQFLASNPESWMSVFETGSVQLQSEFLGFRLWMFVDKIQEPKTVMLLEVADPFGENAEFLRLLVLPDLLKLSLDRSKLASWIDRILPSIFKLSSPLLLVSEEGSGRDQLLSFLNHYRFGDDLVWFRPGNLPEGVQLREAFGDPTGERLRSSEPVPIVNQSQYIVIEEASNLTPAVQSRLVTIMNQEKGRFWIFESSRDLSEMVSAGKFNSELYSLLNRNQVLVPPLRLQSDQDLIAQTNKFLAQLFCKYQREVKLSALAASSLRQYDWPGNLDELYKTIEAAYFLSRSDEIQPADLHFGLWYRSEADTLNLRQHTEDLERRLLLEAYSLHGGNQVHMAKSLGISRGSLQYRWARLGLQEAAQ